MAPCCHTCDHRTNDLSTSANPTPLDVTIIALNFKSPVEGNWTLFTALNGTLNNIADSAENTSHPTHFTSWSPVIDAPKTAVIVTTASETCANAASPIFEPVREHLTQPPVVQHVFLDYSILSLAASSPENRIPCDIILMHAPSPAIAGAIGKRFGWDPKRSSLSVHLECGAGATFSKPGDLTRDFWAWAELSGEDPMSPSSSLSVNSEGDGILAATNSDEKNMGFYDETFDDGKRTMEDETLVMLFQWSSLAAGERFKHPLQRSYGLNDQPVSPDLWDRQVAHPVRQMEGIGAKVETFKVELRGVEPRMQEKTSNRVRGSSSSRRLSTMVTGLWK